MLKMKHIIEIKDKERNIYYQTNPRKFDEIVQIANQKKRYGCFLKHHRKDLYGFVMQHTSFLDKLGEIRFGSRLHCIFHGIVEVPSCKTCGKQLSMKDVRIHEPMPRFCSSRCSMSSEETQLKMKKTMKGNYGVEHALQDPVIKEKALKHAKETNIKTYGVECTLSLPETQKKKEQTNLDRYGVKCTLQASCVKEKTKQHNVETYGVEHHMQDKATYEKSRNTCKRLYGDEHPIRTNHVKEKLKQTNRSLYGVDWTFESTNNKEKSKRKCQEKYGTDYALQSPEVKDKAKSTLRENYGVERNSQILDVRKSSHKKYSYDGRQFDSSAELCFYIWLVDAGIEFEFQPDIHLEYMFNGQAHRYFPDFIVGGMLFEIKGDHFFEDRDPRKKMICPYDHSQDALYEAKHQCMLENNVIIVTSEGYAMFQHYAKCIYGNNYWKRFKNT